MSDINNISITGRISKKYPIIENNSVILNFTIAVSHAPKNGEDVTSFFYATAFGKNADSIDKYFNVGRRIGLEGYIKQDRWESNGKKNSKVSLIVDKFSFIDSKIDKENDEIDTHKFDTTRNNQTLEEILGEIPKRFEEKSNPLAEPVPPTYSIDDLRNSDDDVPF